MWHGVLLNLGAALACGVNVYHPSLCHNRLLRRTSEILVYANIVAALSWFIQPL